MARLRARGAAGRRGDDRPRASSTSASGCCCRSPSGRARWSSSPAARDGLLRDAHRAGQPAQGAGGDPGGARTAAGSPTARSSATAPTAQTCRRRQILDHFGDQRAGRADGPLLRRVRPGRGARRALAAAPTERARGAPAERRRRGAGTTGRRASAPMRRGGAMAPVDEGEFDAAAGLAAGAGGGQAGVHGGDRLGAARGPARAAARARGADRGQGYRPGVLREAWRVAAGDARASWARRRRASTASGGSTLAARRGIG